MIHHGLNLAHFFPHDPEFQMDVDTVHRFSVARRRHCRLSVRPKLPPSIKLCGDVENLSGMPVG